MIFKDAVLCLFLLLISVSTPAKAALLCSQILNSSTEVRHPGLEILKNFEAFDFQRHPLTLGIEVEALFPKNIARERLATLVREALLSEEPGLDIRIEGLKVLYEKDGQEYVYEIAQDPSIKTTPKTQDVELISPIMRSHQDIQVFYHVLNALKKQAGLKPEPTSSGTHIHIGFPEAQMPELALLAYLFQSLDKEVAETFSVLPSRADEYAQAFSQTEMDFLIDAATLNQPFIRMSAGYIKASNKALNINALKETGTVEFRIFNSTVSPSQIQVMLDFVSKLTVAVREKDPRLVTFLKNHINESEFSLDALALALDMEIGSNKKILRQLRRQTLFYFAKQKIADKALKPLKGIFAIIMGTKSVFDDEDMD